MTVRKIILWLGVLAIAWLPARPEARDLKHTMQEGGNTGYFDAHTHWPNGILPWQAFCKMLPGHDGAEDAAAMDAPVTPATPQAILNRRLRMYEDLFATIRRWITVPGEHLEGPVRGARLCRADYAIIHRRLPVITAQPGTANWSVEFRKRYDAYEESLNMLLTATPRTTYDAAYAIRGVFMKELARDGITYSEQSCGLDTALACTPDRLDEAWAQVAGSLRGLPKPEVHFLLQFTQPLLAAVGPLEDDKWAYYRTTDGRPEKGPANSLNTRNRGLLLKLEEEPGLNPLRLANVAGVDILSPEKTIITEDGKKNFVRLIQAVYGFARAAHRRMLVRSHVGEGVPVEPEHGTTPEALDQPPPQELLDRRTGKPMHYRLARNNVTGLLEAVEAFRAGLATDQDRAAFDGSINIRFGHVSHASQEQAKRMAGDHVWADVCLTSNLTTRTINQLYEHSLPALAAEHVHVVLGTDGPGVEHSVMAEEPEVALRALKSVPHPETYVQKMFEDSINYVNWKAGLRSTLP